MLCEGRVDELGLSDDVWTQLQQLRDVVQRAANDRVAKMARATHQLEELTACLNGASVLPLPQVNPPRTFSFSALVGDEPIAACSAAHARYAR